MIQAISHPISERPPDACWVDVLNIPMVRVIILSQRPYHCAFPSANAVVEERKRNLIVFFLLLPFCISPFLCIFFLFLHYLGCRGFRQGSGGRSGLSYIIMIPSLFLVMLRAHARCSLLVLTPMLFSSLLSRSLFGHKVQYHIIGKKVLLELR